MSRAAVPIYIWIFLMAAAVAALGQPVVPAKPALTAVLENGIEPEPGGVRVDFGPVDRLVASTVERTVTIKNDAADPVVIERLQPSCSCTTALLSGTDLPGQGATLKAGESIGLKISLDLANQASGKVSKFLWLFRHGDLARL
jgi:hypothetical protein